MKTVFSLIISCSLLGSPVLAQSDARAGELSYYVVRQPVSQFFDQLALDTGIQIDVAARIPGTIKSTLVKGDVSSVLNSLASTFGFHWFFFNNVYYVSPISDGEVRLVRLNEISSAQALEVLAEAGLLSDRFPVIEAAQGQAIALTGPPKLLALSEAIIESVVREAPSPAVRPASALAVAAPVSAAQAEVQRDSLRLYRGTSVSVLE